MIKALLGLCVGLLLAWGLTLSKQNKKLSESLKQAENNIEAYQGIVSYNPQQANNVLQLDVTKFNNSIDPVLKNIDEMVKKYGINASNVSTVATQNQVLNVNKSKGVGGDILVKDTIYSDSIHYNDLTKVFYTIGNDTVNIRLDVQNTQYLFTYKKKVWKNKKNFFKRLFTLDFKKIWKYEYKIVNTNDLFKEDSVRVIENTIN